MKQHLINNSSAEKSGYFRVEIFICNYTMANIAIIIQAVVYP